MSRGVEIAVGWGVFGGPRRRGLAAIAGVLFGLVAMSGCGGSEDGGGDGGDGARGGSSGASGARGGSSGASGESGATNGGSGATGGSSSGGSEPTGGSSHGGTAGSTGGTSSTGGSSGSGGSLPECTTTPGEGVPLDELAVRYSEASCALYERCAPQDYAVYRKGPGGCVGVLTRLNESSWAESIQRGVDAGTVRYDGAAMAACIQALPTLDCARDPLSESACYCAVQGNVAEDGDCLNEMECAGESRCVAPEVGVCVAGSCAPRVGLGEPCSEPNADECAFALDCVENPEYPQENWRFECGARVPEDGACALFEAPRCAGLLICRATSSLSGTCERPTLVGMGEVCAPVDGIACSEGECVITETDEDDNRISRCAPVVAPDGVCHSGYPDDCPASQYCPLTSMDLLRGVFTSNCVPTLPPGESCDTMLYGADCGTYPMNGCGPEGCEALGDIGGTCVSDAGCWSMRCSGATPVCDVPTVCN